MESIRSRLLEVLRLAQDGVGGERENAEVLLAKLLRKHSMTMADLEGALDQPRACVWLDRIKSIGAGPRNSKHPEKVHFVGRSSGASGGSADQQTCGTFDYAYHSCRNRHCAKCQEDRAHDWLTDVRARMLPCDHYLLTFTLPQQLRALARAHQDAVYSALLQEAAAAVRRRH